MHMKKTITLLVLTFAVAITVFTGIAYAAAPNSIPTSSYYYSFSVSLPKEGKTVTGVAREKVISVNYAYYDLKTVVNTSAFPCYLNVRSSDAKTIVGNAVTVTGSGARNVYLDQSVCHNSQRNILVQSIYVVFGTPGRAGY